MEQAKEEKKKTKKSLQRPSEWQLRAAAAM